MYRSAAAAMHSKGAGAVHKDYFELDVSLQRTSLAVPRLTYDGAADADANVLLVILSMLSQNASEVRTIHHHAG